MKKLLSIAALILAFTPVAQAQNTPEALAGHPDARNDRSMATQDRGTIGPQRHAGAKKVRHGMRHRQAKKHQRIPKQQPPSPAS